MPRSKLFIHERDPINEPSMQMESMVELDDIDQIGGDDHELAKSFQEYKQRRES